MSVVCSPLRHAHCTNMGATHLVEKLITVCVLCPLLTPTPLVLLPADRLQADGIV